MKSKLIALLAAGLLGASSAFASQVLVTSSPNRDFGGGGGAFTVDFLPVGGSTIQAFCLELSENINVGSVYDYTIDTGAIRGGSNTGPGGAVGFDPLSVGSAYLMAKYNAAIPGLPATGASDMVMSSHTLQDAFWALESEKAWNLNNIFLQEVVLAFGSSAAAQASASLAQLNAYGVRVLNITTPGTTPQDANHYRQSLIIYVPDSGTTLILLGCSLGFVGFVSRRFRR